MATEMRIMVVDRRRGFANMLGGLLNDAGLACVGVASTVAEALDLIEMHRTDLLVFGAHPQEAVAGTRALKKQQPDIEVILVTAASEKVVSQLLARAGATGVLADTSSPDDILAVIQRVAAHRDRGGELMPPIDSGANEAAAPSALQQDGRKQLTRRELDVLRLMGDAVPPKQIAARLRISVHTCRDHIRSIQGKLGCHSALEAVLEAQQRGLLPKPA
jgi:DNA-binding NarL/FixJ family response regulator